MQSLSKYLTQALTKPDSANSVYEELLDANDDATYELVCIMNPSGVKFFQQSLEYLEKEITSAIQRPL